MCVCDRCCALVDHFRHKCGVMSISNRLNHSHSFSIIVEIISKLASVLNMDFPYLPSLSQVPYPHSWMLPELQIAGLGDYSVNCPVS